MKAQPRKTCPRCNRQHSRKGVRFCDPCERAGHGWPFSYNGTKQ